MHLRVAAKYDAPCPQSFNRATLVCVCTLQRLQLTTERERQWLAKGCYTSVFCTFTVYNRFVTYKLVTLVAFHGFMVSTTYNYIITNSGKLLRGHMLGNV